MLSEILVYLRLGFQHILDPRGYDHILFIVALTAVYAPREWTRVVVLVTAFTVGHTITLVLATLDLVRVRSGTVEFLIALTILVTAILNAIELWWARSDGGGGVVTGLEPRTGRLAKYFLALCFGLIHGLGFSTFLRAALGAESSIALPLLSFNVGLEMGQISLVVGLMILAGIMTGAVRIPRQGWTLMLSGAAGAVALGLVFERLPF